MNCIFTNYTTNSSGSFPITKYDAQIYLSGIQIDNANKKIFDRIEILYTELTTWCPPGILKNEEENISSQKREIISAEIDRNTIINIKLNEKQSHNFNYNLISTTIYSTILEIIKKEEWSKGLIC